MVEPRYEVAPAGRGRAVYRECLSICAEAGLELDDWQDYSIERLLRTNGSGKSRKWAAPEGGVVIPRQNGKGGILEALELSSLFSKLAPVPLTIHSAHQFDTSLDAFRRLKNLVLESSLRKQLQRNRRGDLAVTHSHGEEGMETANGTRIRFRTRTKGGGRGFSCGRLILDEAMVLADMAFGALLPTLSAQPNPQVIYTGSAVDQLVHEHGLVLARLRKRALEGGTGLAYLEWSAEAEIEELDDVIDDREQWRKANPAVDIRIREEFIQTERDAMDARTFGVERLGVGDWPPVDAADKSAIDFELWKTLRDPDSFAQDPVVAAFDVMPDRSRASVGIAAPRISDQRFHVEIAYAQRGTGWIANWLEGFVERNNPEAVIYDPRSPAAGLVKQIEKRGLTLEQTTANEYAAACGLFSDLVQNDGLRHLGQHELDAAVRNASTRPLGESWAWSRRLSAGDISPLVAVTLALHRAHASSSSVYEGRGLLAV